MANYTWLFFDADGTLFDYNRSEARALKNTFQDFHFDYSAHCADTYRKINAQIWVDFERGLITSQALRVQRFQRLFEALQITAEVEAFSARYLVHLSQQGHLIDGAQELLESLAGTYRMAIITNGLQDVQRPRLNQSGIARYFDEIAISEEIGAAKPDPAFFEAVFARTGHPRKAEVLVIGDGLNSDILGGLQYGLDTCWFNPHGRAADPHIPATHEIHHLTELSSIL